MEDDVDIPTLIQMSLSGDQESIDQATERLTQIEDDPESINEFINLFENENNIINKDRYLLYIYKICKKHWNDYDEDAKNSLIEKFCFFIQNSNEKEIIQRLANIFSLIYSITKQASIADIVFSSENNDFILDWFSKTGSDLSTEVIEIYIDKLVELGRWGLSQPNFSYFSNATNIFCNIAQFIQDQEVFEPVCQYLIEILPDEPNFNDDNQNTIKKNYWNLVDELFHQKILPMESFDQFLEAICNSPIQFYAINSFSDLIVDLSKEHLVQFLQLDIDILANTIENDSTLPEDSFEIFYNTIAQKCERQLVFDMINELMDGDELHQCTGVYLLIPFIQAAPVTSEGEVKFIFDCIQNSLNNASQTFQEAAFRVIDTFEQSSPELVSVFPKLIELVSHFISNEDISICSQAYNSIIILLNECDAEIEGLLPEVWNFLSNGQVQIELMSSYIEVLSLLIGHSEELDDDLADEILEWLEGVFEDEEQNDLSIRSSALSIVSSLIKIEESMCDSLLPYCEQTVSECFKSTDGDESNSSNITAITSSFRFLENLARNLKENSVPIISKFLPNIENELQSEQYKINAVTTASAYTGYSGDTSLLEELLEITEKLLKDEDSTNQDFGCDCAIYLARALTSNPKALDLYRLVLDILVDEKEQELLDTSFRAAKSLYKRCHSIDEKIGSEFISLTNDFLIKFMSGEITYLEGEPPFENPKMDYLMQNAMDYIGVFFQSNPENVTPICESLVEWMKRTSENNMFAILGALTDALEFCQIDESIPIEMCTFVQSNINQITDPDLQQNVSYFLGLLCRVFPQQVELVQQVLPFVINWWEKALDKKIGYQEVLSNIASFFLAFALLDPKCPENLIIGAIQQFPPPGDLLETETMCSSMISLLEKNEVSKKVLIEMALAFARLFTESQTQIESRKIDQSVFDQCIAVFKQLIQDEQIEEAVFSKYEKRKMKKQQLIDLISE